MKTSHRTDPGSGLQPSQFWEDLLGVHVLDPDGWDRKNFWESWAEPITEAEFRKRLAVSTVSNLVIPE